MTQKGSDLRGVRPSDKRPLHAGLRATIAFTFGIRLVALLRSLILARLLGPSTFGLFAGVVAFTGLVALVADLGLTPYAVYNNSRSRPQAATVAAFSLASGLVGATVVMVLSIPIAAFYHQPSAQPIALVLSVSVILGTLAAAPTGVLRSELRFSAIGAAQTAGEVAALGLGVGVALFGGGVWALVAAFLVSPLIALPLLWKWSGIGRPKLSPDWRHIARAALSYGGPVVGGGIVWAVALSGDNIVVGRNLGTTMLGLYAFAYSYGMLPGGIVAGIVGPVAFPVFARVRDDLPLLNDYFVHFVRLSSLVGMPAMAVSVALAPVATNLLLGPRWAGAVLPLQLFLLVGALRAVFPTDQIFRALGKTKLELMTGLVAAPATVVAALIGSRYGIVVVAVLVSAVAMASAFWSEWLAARLLRIGMARLIVLPLPALVASVGAGLLAWYTSWLPLSPAMKLVGGLLVAAALYGLALWSGRLPGGTDLKDLILHRRLEVAEA